MNETAAVASSGEGTQVQEQKPTAVVGKKVKGTGDFILDTATEIENLTKQKALNKAANLVENIEENYFELGGVLKKIHEQSWHDGSADFNTFVLEHYGFAGRKARYLIEIYENIVTKNISWEKVKHLGWTKLKELAKFLTPENTDEWVAKVENITVAELLAMLKGDGGKDGTAKTTDGITTLKFKLKPDQVETVQSALAKGKAESNTEYDTVALENICLGYLGNSVAIGVVAAPKTIDESITEAGWEATLEAFGKLFPKINLQVDVSQHEAA